MLTVDLHLRPEAREGIAAHPHGHLVRAVVEGDAADPAIIRDFAARIARDPGPVLVFLDDDHNAEHVYREMQGYAPLVSPGSYLIVADTVFADLAGTPVGQTTEKYPDVLRSNPRVAINRFLDERTDFARVDPPIPHGPSNFHDGFLLRALLSLAPSGVEGASEMFSTGRMPRPACFSNPSTQRNVRRPR